jgi:hypothetical protein
VVIPSLVRDMTDPSEFDTMTTGFSCVFIICLCSLNLKSVFQVVARSIYALIGCAGYLMSWKSVFQEVQLSYLYSFDPLSLPAPFFVQISIVQGGSQSRGPIDARHQPSRCRVSSLLAPSYYIGSATGRPETRVKSAGISATKGTSASARVLTPRIWVHPHVNS